MMHFYLRMCLRASLGGGLISRDELWVDTIKVLKLLIDGGGDGWINFFLQNIMSMGNWNF